MSSYRDQSSACRSALWICSWILLSVISLSLGEKVRRRTLFFGLSILVTMGFEELNAHLQISSAVWHLTYSTQVRLVSIYLPKHPRGNYHIGCQLLDVGRYQIFERFLEIVEFLDLHILECPRPNVLKILRDEAQPCKIPDMRAALLSSPQLSQFSYSWFLM